MMYDGRPADWQNPVTFIAEKVVTLHCYAENTKPQPTFQWFLDSEPNYEVTSINMTTEMLFYESRTNLLFVIYCFNCIQSSKLDVPLEIKLFAFLCYIFLNSRSILFLSLVAFNCFG